MKKILATALSICVLAHSGTISSGMMDGALNAVASKKVAEAE
jgi:hypothetical protein